MAKSDVLSSCFVLPHQEFFARIFGTAPLHTTANALGQHAEVPMTAREVEEVLTSSGLRTRSLRVVRNDDYLPEENYGRPAPGDAPGSPPYVDPDKVRQAILGGYSLILRSVHRYSPRAGSFARRLAGQLGHPVTMNVFVTPPGSHAVSTHFDYDDVFVFQLSGEKNWKIWDPPILSPLPSQAWTKFHDQQRTEILASLGKPQELTLRTGDVLYLPRGFLHGAESVDHASVHLTAAMAPITRVDVLHQLVEALAAEDEWLREAAHVAEFNGSDAREIFTNLAQLTPFDDIAAKARWKLRQLAWADLPPQPLTVLPQAKQVPEFQHEPDRYQLREGLIFDLVTKENDVCFRTPETEISIPGRFAPMLDRVLNGEGFSTADLTMIESDAESEDAAALVQALTECGVLVVAQ
ncbi:JmjC domain-containing protein [Streptomyces sp. NPDC001732]